VIFTLAALITAIITAHTQTVYIPNFQPAHLTPYIQHVGSARLLPRITPSGPGG
jgi:hypothetical protein